ncbi:MSC_0775 family lipoprotein [Mycoplasmopsis columboralis]|uniref:Lipoprotein n=1 Tax=Mycoplasmopsis columboralis TaxID=171282 RepID=A0A449B5V3_9BACT|nr:hypothetical protein [Mycoplasmopsis columboralis]VEU75945.1 Uncharacterised protein [Mycoplasmopsis columboralis]
MKKIFFKKFLIPTTFLTGISTSMVLASCTANDSISQSDVENFVANKYSLTITSTNKSAFDLESSDITLTNNTNETKLSFESTLLNDLENPNAFISSGYSLDAVTNKMLAGEVLVKVKITFKDSKQTLSYDKYLFVKGALNYERALEQISDKIDFELPNLANVTLPLEKNISKYNHDLGDLKYNLNSLNLQLNNNTKFIVKTNNALTGIVKLVPIRYFSSKSQKFLYKELPLDQELVLHQQQFIPTLDVVLDTKQYLAPLRVDLSQNTKFANRSLSELNPSELKFEDLQNSLYLGDLIDLKTNQSITLPEFYKHNIIESINSIQTNDNDGQMVVNLTLRLPHLDNVQYFSTQGLTNYESQRVKTQLILGGFKNDKSSIVANNDIPQEANNIVTTTSSSNVLNDILEAFDYTSSSEFFTFKDQVNIQNLAFRDFANNNYIKQHTTFNEVALKDLLKTKFNNYASLINSLKVRIRYHDIRQREGNKNQTIIPIDLVHVIDSNKYLYEFRTVNFVVDNLGLNTNNDKWIQLSSSLDNLINDIKQNPLNVTLANKFLTASVVQNTPVEQLSVSQLNKLFKVSLSEELKNQLNTLWEENKYISNIFVSKVRFDANVHKLKATIRVALSDNANEYNQLIKQIQKEDPQASLTLVQAQEKLQNTSRSNLGKDIEITLNYANSGLENYLLNEQLASLVKVNIAHTNEAHYNFEKFNLADFTFTKPNNFSYLQLVSHKVIDAKNVDFTFKAIDATNQKEYQFTKHFGLGHFSNIFEEEFTKNNINSYNFIAGPLTKQNLSKVNAQIFSLYGSNLLTGGYDELRGFYASSPSFPYQLHLGEDYLAPNKTAIVAPYDGEILGIVYHDNVSKANDIAEGVGTTLLMRVKVEDMNLSPKDKELYFKDSLYAYIGVIHLDQEQTFNNKALNISSKEIEQTDSKGNKTIDVYATKFDAQLNDYVAITPDNPLKVTKNQIIAYIGDTHENGGWMSHAHVSVIVSGERNWNENGFWAPKRDYYESRLKTYNPDSPRFNWSGIRVPGVAFNSGDLSKQRNLQAPKVDPQSGKVIIPKEDSDTLYSFTIFPIEAQEMRNGLRNPNILFKLRTKETYAFDISELFKINN